MSKLILIEHIKVKHLLEVGDTVECMEGFKHDWDGEIYDTAMEDLCYGGSSYRAGQRYIIGDIDYDNDRPLFWPEGGEGGIFTNSVRLIRKKDGK